jgi:RHS repeat-associated protein
MKLIKNKFTSSLIISVFLCAAQLVSAFYDPSLGRWINRDPIGDSGFDAIREQATSLLVDNLNRHRLVSNNPVNNIDYMGLAAVPSGTCSGATPLNNNSAECEKYGNRTYLGASLKCFCQCPLNDPWSTFVRGCLRCMDENGYSTGDAHEHCYSLADSAYPGTKPTGKLACCFHNCLPWDDIIVNH